MRRAAAATALALLAGLTWLVAGRAEVHVDDTEHLHVAARLAAGERLYTDVFQKQVGPFWALLGPVVRSSAPDGGRAVLRARWLMAAFAFVALLCTLGLARALGASPLAAVGAPALALASPNLARMLVIARPDAPMWTLALGGLLALARHAARPDRRLLVAGGALLGLATVVLLKAAPLALAAVGATAFLAPRGQRLRDGLVATCAAAAPVAAWVALEAAQGRLEFAAFFGLRFNAAFYAVAPTTEPAAWAGLVRVALAEIARVEPWMLGLVPLSAAWLLLRTLRARRPDDPTARAAPLVLALAAVGALVLAVTALPFESYFVPLELAAVATAPALIERSLAGLVARRPRVRALLVTATVALLGLGLARHLDRATLSPSVARQYATLMAFEARGDEVRHYPVYPPESRPERYQRRLWYRGPMRARALETFCRLEAAGSIPAGIRSSWRAEYAPSCGASQVR